MVYDKIKMVMAENLSKELLAKSPKKKGLVAIKIKKGFDTEIDDIKGSPTDYIKDLAKKENIDMTKIFSKFKDE